MSPLRRSACALLVLAFCVGPAPAQVFGGFSVSGKPGPFIKQVATRKIEAPTADDRALGFGGQEQGEFQSGRMRLPATEARLNAMIAQVSAGWPYAKPPPINVYVLADGKYGPYALPDGSVAVPLGFLIQAESDDEIAFVLGHEYGHLALGHFARNDRLKSQRRLVRSAETIYDSGAALSQMRAQEAGGRVNITVADQRKIDESQKRAAAAADRLNWILDNLVEPAWSRRQEDEADALGYDLASADRYGAADGAAAAFARFTADADARAALVKELQGQLTASVADTLKATNGQSPTAFLAALSKSVQSGLREGALAAAEAFLSPKHRPPMQRRKGLADYSDAAYPDGAPLTAPKTVWLRQVRGTAEFAGAKSAVVALQTAQQQRGAGQFNAAAQTIRVALATPYGGLPAIANEAGRIFRDADQPAQAETWFTRADASRDQTLDGFRDHVALAMSQRNWARATQVIAIFTARTKSDKDFLPELIRINLKQGRNDTATQMLARCVGYDEPALRNRCLLFAYGPDDPEWDKLPKATKDQIEQSRRKASTTLAVTGGLGDLLKKVQKGLEGD